MHVFGDCVTCLARRWWCLRLNTGHVLIPLLLQAVQLLWVCLWALMWSWCSAALAHGMCSSWPGGASLCRRLPSWKVRVWV